MYVAVFSFGTGNGAGVRSSHCLQSGGRIAVAELIASELFGHRKGAFTGADRDRKGVIREANRCTLFLDEIGELPLAAQVMLLRFLQEGEVRPMGETKPMKVDVRVIAATNRDLEAVLEAGRFRNDLYYRLDKLRLRVPPLRERPEDIPLLIEHFFRRYTQEMGKEGLRLSNEVLALMLDYHWPGNAREVENVLYRTVAFAGNGEEIGMERFREEAGICGLPSAAVVTEGRGMIDLDLPFHEATDELKRLLIERALEKTGGNQIQAAARLKINRDGLRKMINRLKIKVARDDRRK